MHNLAPFGKDALEPPLVISCLTRSISAVGSKTEMINKCNITHPPLVIMCKRQALRVWLTLFRA